MHIETDIKVQYAKPPATNDAVMSHASHSTNCYCQVILMTCKIQVVGPIGYTAQARALLDSASSTLVVSGELMHILLPEAWYEEWYGLASCTSTEKEGLYLLIRLCCPE